MKLYIHTSGRFTAKQQKTLSTFAAYPKLLRSCRLVVQAKQLQDYREVADHFGVERLMLPPKIKQLSPTRQFLLDYEKQPFVMMDDDLLFFERRRDDPTKFVKITGDDVYYMFEKLLARMKHGGYAHGGVLAREGGNRIVGQRDVYNTRMMRVLAYNPTMVRKAGARFDRLQFKQDFDMTLQLLRAGLSNSVMADYVQGQYNEGCSNAPGGCSAYRSVDASTKAAHDLAKLHPGFVKVVEKTTSTSWGGGTRTDVQIQWKKAYESAIRNS